MGQRAQSHKRGGGADSHVQKGTRHRGGSTQTASRPISGRATGPRHLCMHPGCGLHASGGLSAKRTLNWVVDILMRKQLAERHPRPPSSRGSGGRSTSFCRSALQNFASQAYKHSQAKGSHARRSQSSWLACSPQGTLRRKSVSHSVWHLCML